MKKVLLFASAMLITAGVSFAATVDYSATAVFDCNGVGNCTGTGTGVATFTVGQNSILTVTYTPNANSVVTPSNTNYGSIALACSNCNGSAFTLDGLLLNLSLTQQNGNPFNAGPAALSTGTFSGFLVVTGNTQTGLPLVDFSPTTPALVFGPTGGITVTYTVDPQVRPSVTNAVNITGTVNARTDETGAPEPGTVGLIGLGLAGLGIVARRRK